MLAPLAQIQPRGSGIQTIDAHLEGVEILVIRRNGKAGRQCYCRHHRPVRRRKFQRRQLGNLEPAHRLAFTARRLALPGGDIAKMQGDVQILVLVGNRHERRGNRRLHAQFLLQLPGQGHRQ